MPSQHQFPAAIYRADPALYERAKAAVAEVDSNLNAHIVAFLHWLVRDTDDLPSRPDHRVTNVRG
ncbi:hypothetical protein [Kibdelosporangium phytohabitans]|uniref:Uncharacterized protein n=1 Tax=Kibdelosporangium phytohabitans TaxID=860235 RepID=A0A0N9HUL4_9PSEU|nr:hypothetical protein [Kibdelosporangium phytohabitans]ALG05792.1 hypothetical protein AOZ06_01605 [Kibdelosporangium phytohabitans]MBE1466198.1 hypothetical protein [Kibdelosporangium phytohabitans]